MRHNFQTAKLVNQISGKLSLLPPSKEIDSSALISTRCGGWKERIAIQAPLAKLPKRPAGPAQGRRVEEVHQTRISLPPDDSGNELAAPEYSAKPVIARRLKAGQAKQRIYARASHRKLLRQSKGMIIDEKRASREEASGCAKVYLMRLKPR